MECDDCGVSKNDDLSVEETFCPYNEDVNGTITECILCSNCYNERCQDI